MAFSAHYAQAENVPVIISVDFSHLAQVCAAVGRGCNGRLGRGQAAV